jgi:Flp pilus assembly protein TadB
MLLRKSQRASAFAAIAAVLALAVTLLATRGVIDALLLIAIAAVLAGMYLLRRYARAVMLYRRRSRPHQQHPQGELLSSAPTAGRADTNRG